MLLTALVFAQVTVLSDRPPRRLEVTPEHLATAFRDADAKAIVTRASAARRENDASLRSYTATVRQRMTAELAIGENGRERPMYGSQTASTVRWVPRRTSHRARSRAGRVARGIHPDKKFRVDLSLGGRW